MASATPRNTVALARGERWIDTPSRRERRIGVQLPGEVHWQMDRADHAGALFAAQALSKP